MGWRINGLVEARNINRWITNEDRADVFKEFQQARGVDQPPGEHGTDIGEIPRVAALQF